MQVNAIDGYSRAALHYAAERDPYCLETLLHHKADPKVKDANDCSALHWAAFKNNIPCVKMLIEHGVDVDVLDFNLCTPLSWAAPRGHLETVVVLLDYNADVDLRNYNDETALKRCVAMHATGLRDEKLQQCIELLVRASGSDIDASCLVNNKFENLLPRSLKDLSRHRIRKSLHKSYLPRLVLELPVPWCLQQFILLRH